MNTRSLQNNSFNINQFNTRQSANCPNKTVLDVLTKPKILAQAKQAKVSSSEGRTKQKQANQLNNINYYFKYEVKSSLEAPFQGIKGYFKQMTALLLSRSISLR